MTVTLIRNLRSSKMHLQKHPYDTLQSLSYRSWPLNQRLPDYTVQEPLWFGKLWMFKIHAFSEHLAYFIPLHTAGFTLSDGFLCVSRVRRLIFRCIPVAELLCLVTRHHKARITTNNEFYVVRFLPQQVTDIMYRYLVYIQYNTIYYARRPVLTERALVAN
jgi:hypothetical protein